MSETSRTASEAVRRVFVWDLPLRLFHWSLPLLLIVLYVTAEVMDDGIETHALAGYALLALLLFRLLWGFVGGTYARFAEFLRGPQAVLRYTRTLPTKAMDPYAGHTPLGGWVMLVLLAGLLLQAVLGLFSNDDILFDGPLRRLVSKEMSDTLTALHAELFPVLLGLIILHIGAVLYYRLRKGENLVSAMITGYKKLPAEADAVPSQGGKSWLAALLLGGCALAVYFVVG